MQRFFSLALLTLLAFGLGIIFSCISSGGGGGGVDDDGDSSGGDDDADDDDGGGDDETNDDDNADDDSVLEDTWTDPASGLTWQVTPPSKKMNWGASKSYCENLALEGGGWHLPTISELRTLIRGCDGTVTGGPCDVSDSCLISLCQDMPCYSCTSGDGPNNGCYGPKKLPGECDTYWSSSALTDIANSTWVISFNDGYISECPLNPEGEPGVIVTRCVR